MNKTGGRKFCLFCVSSAELKLIGIVIGITMPIVVAGLTWLNSGARGVTPAQWMFVCIYAGLFFSRGCYLVKRNRNKEVMTRKLLYGTQPPASVDLIRNPRVQFAVGTIVVLTIATMFFITLLQR